jgi:hypothetical protein
LNGSAKLDECLELHYTNFNQNFLSEKLDLLLDFIIEDEIQIFYEKKKLFMNKVNQNNVWGEFRKEQDLLIKSLIFIRFEKRA